MVSEIKRPVQRLALGMTEAALALGVSTTSFLTMVEERVMPPARVWHSRKLWIVSELEAALFELASEGPIMPRDNFLTELRHRADGPENWGDATGRSQSRSKSASDKNLSSWRSAQESNEREGIKSSPINRREKAVLAALASYGANVPVDVRQVRGGFHTVERLVIRGFIVHEKSSDGSRSLRYTLTESGLIAFEKLKMQ